MARRRVGKRKRSSRWPNAINREKQFAPVSSMTDVNRSKENQAYRSHDHPYATRSKTLRIACSSMNVDGGDYPDLERRQSDTSIVYLGKYRKVPELVVIEDTGGRCTEFVEVPRSYACLKEERPRKAHR